MTSSYGPIVTAWTVEQAVRDTLQTWIDTVLGEIERQSSGRWDRRQIQRPRSWFIHSEFHDVPEKLLPVIHVESSRVVFEHAGDGQVNGDFPMVVQGVVKSQNRELSRELNAIFEAACRTILGKQGDLGGIAAHTAVQDANYDLVPPDRDRTLMGFEIPIVVTVAAVSNRFGGPTVPDAPAPTPIPTTSPTDPHHLSTHVTISAVSADGDMIPPDSDAPDPTGANVSVLFTMPTAALGTSGAYTVRTQTFIARASLTCATAPQGGPLSVQFNRNGAPFTTLTVPIGLTSSEAIVEIPVGSGDLLSVTSTSVGATTAATNVVAQIDLNDR